MSIWKRIGAGIGAGFGAVGGTLGAMPVQENYSNQQINDDIPAIVQEAPEYAQPRNLEDIVKEQVGDRFTVTMPDKLKETMPDRSQAVGDLGNNMENLASAGSEAAKAKNKAEETERDINASRPPEYGDHPPENGNDYSYGIGM
jgi:hypothetical protein